MPSPTSMRRTLSASDGMVARLPAIPDGARGLDDRERHAGLDPAPPRFARRELQDGASAAPAGEPPGPQIGRPVEDAQVPVEERRVDGEAHEARVDRR